MYVGEMTSFLKSRPYLTAEFAVMCLAVPSYIIVTKSAPFLFAFLWGAVLYGYIILRICEHENLRHIWNWGAIRWPHLKFILLRWAFASLGMLAFIYFYDPDRIFYLPRKKPEIIPFIAVLYPLLSALPQEFIFCNFFFARYKLFFGNGKALITASAIVFAYAHVLYINPVAPPLSFLGGLIFAQTYMKSKSLALVTIEHGLYGISLFITGLGWYFYSGAVN